MLKLKNIRRENNIISAEYEPEASGELGAVSLNVENGEVVESKTTSHDGHFAMYLNHAATALKKMADKDTLPEEKLVMWY